MGRIPKVNLSTRRAYATLLRRFIAGRMTTDEYEDRYDALQDIGWDDASHDVYCAAWHLYDDITPHRMTAVHKVSPELRRSIAKWLLFLRHDSHYEPLKSPFGRLPIRAQVSAVATVLVVLGYLSAAICWFAGWGTGISLSIIVVGTLISMIVGVSVNLSVVAKAFGSPLDPWPFASDEDLRTARSTPTYLYGR